jgi:multiple sugar transport system ATP-binding protein
MARVLLERISKHFGTVRVIENIDLQIADREFLVLVGPSGCGKSTALRLIAGLEEITAGTIRIGERVVNDVAPKDRDIAMVFQSYALYPHMSVRQNLEFGLRIRRMPSAEIARLVTEVADVLGIRDLLDRRPKQLSGGQRQRVAVGRAIVRKPAVFLFDEPLSNLDAKLRVQMRAELLKLQHRLQTTTIYVTHDQVEAMTMGQRIAVLNRGVLQQVGAPLEVYERPTNRFVASFIGTPPMNFLPATVSADGLRLETPGLTLPVPPALEPAAATRRGRPVVIGLRPEHLVEAGRAGRPDWVRISMAVDMVEPLGNEAVLHGRIAGEAVVAKLDPHNLPGVGAAIELAVDTSGMHLFDASTEERLVA